MPGQIIEFPQDAAARDRLAKLRGTPAHAAALVERERALGLDASILARDMLTAPYSAIAAPATTPVTAMTGQPVAPDGVAEHPPLAPPLSLPLAPTARNGLNGSARVCGDPDGHLAHWRYREVDRRFVCDRCFPPDTSCPVCHATRWQPYTASGGAAAAIGDSRQPGGYGFVCGQCHPAPRAERSV